MLTADTVLGRGTTVIDNEDGSLGDYLESLRRLHGLGRRTVLPGHGPDLGDLEAVSAMYLAHREERLDQVRGALRALGDDATVRQIVEHVYTDVDEKLWDAAEWSVQAQLDYLRRLAREMRSPRNARITGTSGRGGPSARSRRSTRSCPPGESSRGGRSRRAPC